MNKLKAWLLAHPTPLLWIQGPAGHGKTSTVETELQAMAAQTRVLRLAAFNLDDACVQAGIAEAASQALQLYPPKGINGVWRLLKSIGFEPYVVLGKADFEEMLQHGGRLLEDGYAEFYPDSLIAGDAVSEHVKRLARELV